MGSASEEKGVPSVKKVVIGADLAAVVSTALLELIAIVMAYTKPSDCQRFVL
jgi:hypothetical protein